MTDREYFATSLIVIKIGAIVKVRWVNGFFLGTKPGFEFNMALIAILLVPLSGAGGRYAIISWLEFLLLKV